MIILGAIILADNLDIFRDFDVWRIWPAALVVIGGVIILSGRKNKPVEINDIPEKDKNDTAATDTPPAADDTSVTES